MQVGASLGNFRKLRGRIYWSTLGLVSYLEVGEIHDHASDGVDRPFDGHFHLKRTKSEADVF